MQMQQLFSQALGITAPWKVVSLSFDSKNKRLDIQVDFKRGSTFTDIDNETGKHEICKAYDTIEKTWRHLNFFEHECYLHARVPRVKRSDGCVRMISPPWAGVVNGFTLLFEALILQLCMGMPVHQVSKLIGVSDHKLWRILDIYVEGARANENYESVTAVGMDETSVSKGHNYISLFVDLEKKRTIFVTEGKDSSTVKRFAQELDDRGGSSKEIKDVSCDMSPAFIKGVREQLPNAEITFDKFHIVKIINEAVDSVRREENKETPLLKGKRYLFLKNEKNLTVKQRTELDSLRMKNSNLKSIKALQIRESFQQLYLASDVLAFESLLKDWYYWASHSCLEPIKKSARTIKAHWDGILRWKQSQINNGILEGLNSVVQAAKRKARGYKVRHFKVIAYLLTGKLSFNGVNHHLPT